MPIQSSVGGAWADALDPIVRFEFDQAFRRRTPLAPSLFSVRSSTRAYEAISGLGAIGVDAWNNLTVAGQVSEVDYDQSYKTTFTHTKFAVDIGIDKSTIDDGQVSGAFDPIARLGDSAAVKREIDAASVFNNAFSASYLGGDAVALCSDSHPLSPQKTGTVQDNNYTLSLTKANLRTIREAMMAFTDDNGNKMAVTPTLLLVPPALEDDGIEIVNSLQDPTSANNTVNAMAGRFRVQPWHYLTDSNAWFLIDENLMKQSLVWWDRDPVSIKMRDGDDRTLRAYWRAYMRYSYGFSDWRWVTGSNPS